MSAKRKLKRAVARLPEHRRKSMLTLIKAGELVVTSIPRVGDTSTDVTVLQEALKKAGFSPGDVDGIFGANTTTAVSRFQKSQGLPGSGVIGPKTLDYLGIKVIAVAPVTGETITRDLAGKRGRRIHPTLRLMLERKLWPDGKVTKPFVDRDLPGMVKAICAALEAMKIREEGGNNRGLKVGLIQGIIGTVNLKGTGDAWCMSTVQVVIALIEDFFGVESPVLDSEHCMTVLAAAKRVPGLVTYQPAVGPMFIMQHGTSSAGHTGFPLKLVSSSSMNTFEGNTGSQSVRDGDGAFFRVRNVKKNGDLFTRGFVFIYPNNKVPAAA